MNLALAVALTMTCLSSPSHHSITDLYDIAKPFTAKGVLAKFEWINPHIQVYVDATDAQGSSTRWRCEGGNPALLSKQGWTKDTLKAGATVTIEGFAAKDGSSTCELRRLQLPGGAWLAAGPASLIPPPSITVH